MAIEFDNREWSRDALGYRETGARVQPDWHGLLARLLAAREAGRAIAGTEAGGAGANPGSFDGAAARRITGFGPDAAFVNLNDSANCNADEVKGSLVAEQFRSGDRG